MDVPMLAQNAGGQSSCRASFERVGIGAAHACGGQKLLADGRNNFYLWVLEGNHAAEKFYTALSGRPADRKQSDFGGKETWATRYVWDDFNELLAED